VAAEPAARSAPWRLAVGALLVVQFALALQWARLTPAWQAPDEPAHFNYVAQLARTPTALPVIESGDYPFDRLEALKAARFPPAASIAGISYEDHQPPAYYYLALPLYELAGPLAGDDAAGERRRLGMVRLLGVALGSLGLALTWRLGLATMPEDRALALAAAAFVGFLPMNLTVTTALNNDALANVLTTGALLLAARRVQNGVSDRAFVSAGGVLGGLALLTKLSALTGLAGLVVAEGLRMWRLRDPLGPGAARALAVLVLATAIASPWLARNARTYDGDWLARTAHDQAVIVIGPNGSPVGQARTADWVETRGWADLLGRMAGFTFRSFWGVFGWLGVFLDARIYALLQLLSGAALVGLVLYLVRLARTVGAAARTRRAVIALLGISIATSAGGYVWWNLTYVQHQGRYLFPALGPIAVLFLVGVRELAGRAGERIGGPPVARGLELAVLGAFVVALVGLAWVSLHGYVIPCLEPGGTSCD
jgi:hypothetical protein